MSQRISKWGCLILPVFGLALATTFFLAWQSRAAAPPPPANFLAANKGYGVTLAPAAGSELAGTLDLLQKNGLTWVRLPVNWAELEPEAGRFNWQSLDRLVDRLSRDQTGFNIIAVLQTSPAWARPDGSPPTTPPTEISDFGNFARTVAARYRDKINYYQIWHEPNLSANWGNAFVDPQAYAGLLHEAALNIRAANPQARILTAALAPTLETGPLNLNELDYLDRLYRAAAAPWFDIVAVQPYGFDSEPSDPPQAGLLNFRRAELLRQVMLAHNDAGTPLWATAFGWNALPEEWSGRPSPWQSNTPAVQARRTAEAIALARRDWPWLGPMLAIRWDSAGLPADDPARGFALADNEPVLEAIAAAATAGAVATPGRYPAVHPSGAYSPGWRFALTGADIPRHEPRTLTLTFEGTRLDLDVNRGPYRGYLWVTVDGEPANALPLDGQGRSYIVLYDPLRQSEPVTVARYLPPGRHRAVIEAEGGWGQWAIGGWEVYHEANSRTATTGLAVAGLVTVLSGLGVVWLVARAPLSIARMAWAWGEILAALSAVPGETGIVVLVFALASGFYLAPPTVALLLLPALALLILLRPDVGLALVVFTLSFFQAPKQLPVGRFSPVELSLAMVVAGFVFRGMLALGRRKFAPEETTPSFAAFAPKSADWAALALVALALLSTFNAANFGVSMHEWRLVVFEPVLFYFLVRLGVDFGVRPQPRPENRWAWRLVDAFVAGAVLQALIALYLYFFTGYAITAEGVRRAMGLAYGSPNNLSLFLDRAWPLLLAVTVFAKTGRRRWAYAAGLAVVSLALYLTFSKGALLLGLPAGLAAMAGLYWQRHGGRNWRKAAAIAGAGVGVIILALVPLSQTARFRTTFDFSAGSTGFFRLKLWQASLAMLRDHWPLGVGLDNFLYLYRTRYILPEAWQEPNLSHPHNLVLDFGTRLGAGGIGLLLWLQGAFWSTAWRLYRRQPSPLVLGLMGSMVVFVSHGLVDNSYFLVDLAFAFFLTVGLVQRLFEQSAGE